jgi:hypothetical protein
MIARLLSCAVAGMLCISTAHAWDTKEFEPKGKGEKAKWQSAYVCMKGGTDACEKNEHEQASNRALKRLAPNSPWGIGGRQDFYALDLNAEYFRSELKGIGEEDYIPTLKKVPLEQRLLPPPPHFAGLPDYSYTVYDWANKNQLCPALPFDHPDKANCHVFSGWHGARLNASHFGNQAVMSYKRMHAIALQLARRASDMRRKARGINEATLKAHIPAIREAEYLAMVYEAAGHHYLGDRWATGHMFDRWGAPEYIKGDYQDPKLAKTAGALTGMLHGHESVSGVPDALSSPELDIATLVAPRWRFPDDETTYPGVGDYRLKNMIKKKFGGEYAWTYYTDYDLPVKVQEEWLLECLAAGYRDVIRAFGAYGGGYGIDKVKITNAGQPQPRYNCFTPRVTNASMLQGWGRTFLTKAALEDASTIYVIGRFVFSPAGELSNRSAGQLLAGLGPRERASLTRMTERLVRYAKRNKDGIEMSSGGIGRLGRMPTGARFPIASYLEPEDIKILPKTKDQRGRDQLSIFGLFNRAGADFMCGETPAILEELRGSTDQKARAICRILAQRLYKGTPKAYNGEQRETPSVDFQNDRTAISPLCAITADKTVEGIDAPMRLTPGYVSWEAGQGGGYKKTGAFSSDAWSVSNQSIANWCDNIPVLEPLPDRDDMDKDIVARVSGRKQLITLKGQNLGDTKGRLLLGATYDNAREIADVTSWNERGIQFRFGEQFTKITFVEAGTKDFPQARLTYAFVERAAGQGGVTGSEKSVGRFAILDNGPQVINVKIVQAGDTQLEYDRGMEDGVRAAEGTYKTFRPIGPGVADITLTLDTPLDLITQSLRASFGSIAVDLSPQSSTQWTGRFTVPEGRGLESMRGFHPIRVRMRTDDAPYRALASAAGSRTGKALFVLLDEEPIYLKAVRVTGPEGTIYDAQWEDRRGGDGEGHRILNVAARKPAPQEGSGTMTLTFSAPIAQKPDVTLSGQRVTLTGEGPTWQAPVSYGALAQLASKQHNILVRIKDAAGKSLDGAPKSIAVLPAPPKMTSPIWRRYEATQYGDTSYSGGTDRWHYISAEEEEDASGLAGLWASSDYECGADGSGLYEEALVSVDGQYVTAVKTKGDSCVLEGMVTWQGMYDRGKIIGRFSTREPKPGAPLNSVAVILNRVGPDEIRQDSTSGSAAMTFKRLKP